MLLIAIVMLVILAVCGVLVAYVAVPHRGEELPAAPWLGDAMAKAADVLPTIDPEPAAESDDSDDGDAATEPPAGKHSLR